MDIKENFKGHLSTINHHKMEVMRLWKVSRTEFFIFAGAFLGVLILGTIN